MKIKEKLIAGYGNYPFVKSKIRETSDQLTIKSLLQDEGNLVARGLGRSYGDQAVNDAQLVALLTPMAKYLSFDHQNGVLECQAGVSLKDIITTFAPRGWFPMISPGTKYVTVGGCIANDIHGKAHHKDGSFVNSVISFTIMTADGQVYDTSREKNEELFWANFGGLGLLGVIITVKLRLRKIETTYFTQKAIKVRNIDHLLDAFEETNEYDYSVAWINSLAKGKGLGKGVLTVGNAAKPDDLPPSKQKNSLFVTGEPKINVPFYFPGFALNTITVKMLNTLLNIVQGSAGSLAHYEKFFYPLDAILNWNRGYGKRGFIQYQFVIPLEDGRKNIRSILEKVAHSGCSPFLNVLKKFGHGQPKAHLSFPMEGYTFAIDFPVTKRLHAFTKELDAMVLDYGGRIYLGKDAMLDETTFKKMYPQHTEWLEIKQKYDPDNKFSSNISRRLGLDIK